ncbi:MULTISPECIES: FAD-binding oxidoreductase [Mesorhizobium]|uniref:FAD-binding oxidoreductase n=1 Tax=Mesorhizobium denitrificans TaxID=2294114 RepID=A0A371XIJ4_9HYPH|nr:MULTISPECIES: FAD-binding oxidoreductase [Mesorhizobium]RFC68874.1 FAD-binding oxidoreductase [Mesorhizobium denitrificans]
MDDALIGRFAAIVGEKYAVRAGADIVPFVSEPRGLYGGVTPLVLRPGSVDEVSRIMALATETRTPVVPQGGNTGLVGGQMPDKSGGQIVLSLSRLNRIREIDTHSNTATVDAGVILETLQQAADQADRLYPLALASQGSCEIGGNLSSNAGGVGALAYGVARDLCLGLEVVLPTGEVLDDLRKLKKDNTGYDLKDLFIGAEGTLGVITAAVVKLFPKPKGREMAWIGLASPEAALALFGRANEAAGAGLTMFELAHRTPLEFAALHLPSPPCPIPLDYEWYVLMEISSGRSGEDARALIESILESALEDGVIEDAAIAANLSQARDFWQLRENLPEAQKPEGASIKHDISVPVAAIPAFIVRAAKAVESVSPGARVCCFGHMGDGNLHYNVSQPVGANPEAFLALYKPMNHAVHDVVRAMDGSISAEHGIGVLKRDELIATAPPVAIDLMRRIKSSFDPAGIMNPGKVI